MAQKKEDVSRKALMLLVVAVLVISLVGTWLVLQGSFESPNTSRSGVVSFQKNGGTVTSVVLRNTETSGKVSFVKQG